MSTNPSTIFPKITVGQLFRKVKISILLEYRMYSLILIGILCSNTYP